MASGKIRKLTLEVDIAYPDKTWPADVLRAALPLMKGVKVFHGFPSDADVVGDVAIPCGVVNNAEEGEEGCLKGSLSVDRLDIPSASVLVALDVLAEGVVREVEDVDGGQVMRKRIKHINAVLGVALLDEREMPDEPADPA